MKKFLLFTILGTMLSNASFAAKVVQLKGSDTILNISQSIAESYMQKNPKSRIAVTGGGSGVGISALINGTTDIGMASRNIKEKELKLAESKGVKIKEIVLGHDGITIILNKNNKINNLTHEQLAKVFRGEIANWKELGGEDAKIVVLSRDTSSGTHEFFKEHIIRENNSKPSAEYGKNTLYMPSNEAIKQEVKSNINAIGYIGMGYYDDSVKDITVDSIEPSVANVMDKKYPIAREVYWYINDNGNADVNSLVEFSLSKEGQDIVKSEGFVPVK